VGEFLLEPALGIGKFERPEEVVRIPEVWSACVNLMNEIFNTDDVLITKYLFNHTVISDRDTLAINLSKSSLVNEVLDGFEVRVSISNEWLDQAQHLNCGSIKLDKNTIVDLSQTKKLQNLSDLGEVIFLGTCFKFINSETGWCVAMVYIHWYFPFTKM